MMNVTSFQSEIPGFNLEYVYIFSQLINFKISAHY